MSWHPDDNFDDGVTPRLTEEALASMMAKEAARKAEICPHCGGSLSLSAARYCDGWQCRAE